jgi:hypothetical protein
MSRSRHASREVKAIAAWQMDLGRHQMSEHRHSQRSKLPVQTGATSGEKLPKRKGP